MHMTHAHAGEVYWVTGEKMEIDIWADEEPNDDYAECTYLNRYTTPYAFLMDDNYCFSSEEFICEKYLSTQTRQIAIHFTVYT